jgi:hypothetical protein
MIPLDTIRRLPTGTTELPTLEKLEPHWTVTKPSHLLTRTFFILTFCFCYPVQLFLTGRLLTIKRSLSLIVILPDQSPWDIFDTSRSSRRHRNGIIRIKERILLPLEYLGHDNSSYHLSFTDREGTASTT